MIKRLIWTIWTPMSSVLKKADKLNLSLSLSLIFLVTNLFRIRSFWPQIPSLPQSFKVQFSVAHSTPPSVFRLEYPHTPHPPHPGIISLQNFAHATTAQLSCHMQNFISITTTWIRGGWILHRIWITMENRLWNQCCTFFRQPIGLLVPEKKNQWDMGPH